MSDRPQYCEPTAVSEEAADWLVRLRDGTLGTAQERNNVLWLKRSPAHVAEMLWMLVLNDLLHKVDLSGIVQRTDAEPPRNNIDCAFDE